MCKGIWCGLLANRADRQTTLFVSYPYPVGYNVFFHHLVIKIRQLFLRPAACLMSTLLESGVGATANASGTNGLTCLPKHGGAQDNKFWLPIR
jgi:hypothetical protein